MEDGLLAADVDIGIPLDMVVSPNGSIYVASTFGCVYQIEPQGRIYRVTRGANGRCLIALPGAPAPIGINPTGLSLAPNGDLYVADHGSNGHGAQILRFRTDGAVFAVAGNGEAGFAGDGGPATAASMAGPLDVAVAPDGSFYIADYWNERVRHVGADGIMTTVAGGGEPADGLGDGGPANAAKLGRVRTVAVDQDGVLYIGHDSVGIFGSRVRRVGSDGVITTVVGGGHRYYEDNELGIESAIHSVVRTLVVGPDNLLYLDEGHRIRRLGADGRMKTVIGTTDFGYSPDGTPINETKLGYPSVAFAPNGVLYLAEVQHHVIRAVNPKLNQLGDGEVIVPANDGAEAYVFAADGRHLRTLDALTGVTRYRFGYDEAGRLVTIADASGQVTRIERNGAGAPTAIVAPFGQRTALSVNEYGYLTSVTDPDGLGRQMSYLDGNGLLDQFTDRNGQVTTLQYDELGRLVSDSHSASAKMTLGRTTTDSGYQVDFSSAGGRTTTYTTQRSATQSEQQVTFADGAHNRTVTQVDGSRWITLANGTQIASSETSDERWQGLTTRLASTRLTTPAGLQRTTRIDRTVLFTDAANPLSMVALTSTVTSNGRRATTFFDLVNQQVQITTPAGRKAIYQLNEVGEVATMQLPGLHPEQRSYDEGGRLRTVTQGSGAAARTTTYGYNQRGLVSDIIDALGRTWAVTYDERGQITALTQPDGSVVRYAYDAQGRRTAVTPPGRQPHYFTYGQTNMAESYRPPTTNGVETTTRYTYDADGQLMRIVAPDGASTTFLYDVVGRLQTVQTADGPISHTYGATGQLEQIVTPQVTLGFTYDGELTTAARWSGAMTGEVRYHYNPDLLLSRIQVNNQPVLDLRYDADELLTQVGELQITRSQAHGFVTGATLRNTSDMVTYNGFGEIASYLAMTNGERLLAVNYTYDAVGRITQRSEELAGTTTRYGYEYDLLGRLVRVTHDGKTLATYDYDANGNRTGLTTPSLELTASYDEQDRLISYGDTNFTYTASGDLHTRTQNGQTTTYRYDTLGNLRSVALPDGREVSYLIDGLNRRVGKQIDGVTVQRFLYLDQLHPVAELDDANNLVSLFVYGSDGDTPTYMVRQGAPYRIFSDQVGSPRLVVNATTGEVVQRLSFDVFGNVVEDTHPGFQPFGFAGGLADLDTGLVRFGARDYDATVGRWTSREPLFFEGGSANLYTYVNNDPVNFTDPTGEAIPLLAALALVWMLVEAGMTASDIADFFTKLFDPCVNTRDKALAGILALLGIIGPGGGYGKLAKWFDKFADLFRGAKKGESLPKASRLSKEYERYLKANDIHSGQIRTAKGPPGTKPSPRNQVGTDWDKR